MGSASNESSFELIDLLIAFRPDLFGHKIVNANNEDILILRAIKNDDLSASGSLALDPPQKIVCEFFDRWLLETDSATTLRIHRGDNMPDDPVLAASVGSLKANQQGPFLFGIKLELQLVHPLPQQFNLGKRLCFILVLVGITRIEVLELQGTPRLDAK